MKKLPLLALFLLGGCLRDFRDQAPLRAELAARTAAAPTGVVAWFADRGRDLTDVVDVKVGWGPGLGAKLNVSRYLVTGLGGSWQRAVAEKTGRLWRIVRGKVEGRPEASFYALWVLSGFLADSSPDGRWEGDLRVSVLGVDWAYAHGRGFFGTMGGKLPLAIDRYSVGAEVHALAGALGLWINPGQLVDLLAGLVGLDPGGDDGLPLGSRDVRPPEPVPVEPSPASDV